MYFYAFLCEKMPRYAIQRDFTLMNASCCRFMTDEVSQTGLLILAVGPGQGEWCGPQLARTRPLDAGRRQIP